MKIKSQLILIATTFLLAACSRMPMATPYQPLSNNEGYMDKQISENEYEIQVRGNGITAHETLVMHFERRAGELCQGRAFDANLKGSQAMHITDSRMQGYGGNFSYTPMKATSLPYVSGTVKCKVK